MLILLENELFYNWTVGRHFPAFQDHIVFVFISTSVLKDIKKLWSGGSHCEGEGQLSINKFFFFNFEGVSNNFLITYNL
jgi:hypothetical protein